MDKLSAIDFVVTRNWNDKDILDSVTIFLVKFFDVKYAFIGLYEPKSKNENQTISFCGNGDIIDNFSYDNRNTPCKDVVDSNRFCCVTDDAQEKYPEDFDLRKMNIISYAGMSTHSYEGHVNGLISIMDDKPINKEIIGTIENILQLFALHVGVHLDNYLKKLNLQNKLNQSTDLALQARIALNKHSIVSATDKAGKIIYVNDKFMEVSGYSNEELIGRNHSILKSGEHDHDYYKKIYKEICSGNIWNGEFKNKRKDGSYYWVNSTIQPTFGYDGKQNGYISIRTEITKQKEKIIEAEQEAAAKDKFISSVSHELRTPLNAVMGYAQLLQDEKNIANFKKYSKTILAACNQLNDYIDEILKFKDDIGPTKGHCNVNVTLEDVLIILQPQIEEKNINLSVAIPPKYNICLSSQHMTHILNNLIINGIKYNHDGGDLDIRCEQNEKKMLDISIMNSGMGIRKEDFPEIFRRFNRGKNANSNIPGNGLGLSIVKEILNKTGGTIKCESDGKSWSKFIVTLPLWKN